MATVSSTLKLFDGMTPALRSITNALNLTISSFEKMQKVSQNSVDISRLQAARIELNKAEAHFAKIQEEINRADKALSKFNNDIRIGESTANALWSRLKGVAATIGAYLGAKEVLNLADSLVLIKSRLDIMNDGLQTTKELQNLIYASAERARSSYLDTAQVVAKLGILAGHAFKNNKEIIAFAELMNKSFKIGGASLEEQTAAMYQLTQAMASGRLQGDEFRSIIENAPILAQAIAKYTGKSIGELKEMSAKGEITADIIKNAMFSAADEINKKFEQMPVTFGQLWTSITNKAIKAFEPVLAKISELTKRDDFNQMINTMIGGLVILANVAMTTFDILSSAVQTIKENWSWLGPIVLSVVGAYLLFNTVAGITNTVLKVQSLWSEVLKARQAMLTGATLAQTAAQHGLNAALLASPITWIIAGIIALIALFYAAVGAVNKFAHTTISATGIIVGIFTTAGAFIGNIFLGVYNFLVGLVAAIWDQIANFAEFLANVFIDPVGSIIRLFSGMAQTVLLILQGIAKAIDTIFRTNLASAISGWQKNLKSWTAKIAGEAKIKVPRLDATKLQIKGFDYAAAWKAGYSFGKNIESKFNVNSIFQNAFKGFNEKNLGLNKYLNDILKNAKDTAKNTSKISDKMDVTDEDLKYLRDIAEREVINRFTTAEIKINMTNNNNISSQMDLDGIVSYLEDKVYETMIAMAEGVHK